MDFFEQALARLLSTAPELGSMILNFSDITDEVGETSGQVGIFILKTGDGIAYCPVVSNSGTVFPIDSLFLDSEKRFVPLTKAIVKKLQVSSGIDQGKAESLPASVSRSPDISSLITPPRTGKFVYASSSRLVEFLAAMPGSMRSRVFEKIASETTLMESLDKAFGLKAIMEVLKAPKSVVGETTASDPHNLSDTAPSVVTTAEEVSNLGDEVMARKFMEEGFVVVKAPETPRVAVSRISASQAGVFRVVNPDTTSDEEYSVVTSSGSTREGYLPRYHSQSYLLSPRKAVIFDNGDYAKGDVVVSGEPRAKKMVMQHFSDMTPPVLLKDCYVDDVVVMVTSDNEFLGPVRLSKVVITPTGVECNVSGGNVRTLIGSKNVKNEVAVIDTTMFVRHNILVYRLNEDVSYDLESNVFTAQARKEFQLANLLGVDLDLRYDGMEFFADNARLGNSPSAMKYLVEKENLDPAVASGFLKEAQQNMYVKVFLTKKAASSTMSSGVDFPTYGAKIPNEDPVGPNGNFLPAANAAAALGDGQVLEATILSQLLQTPDLFELIQEYLPEIKGALDKLGRVLFLSRVKIDQMAGPMDSEAVFALISQVKNVYRTLGDAVIKLEETANSSVGFENNRNKKVVNKV